MMTQKAETHLIASLPVLHTQKSIEEREGGLGTEAISHIYIPLFYEDQCLIFILTTCQGMMRCIYTCGSPRHKLLNNLSPSLMYWYSSAELPPRVGLIDISNIHVFTKCIRAPTLAEL